MSLRRARHRIVVCTENDGDPGSLKVRKLYLVVDDPDAEASHLLRIVDESGEDYLYPEGLFPEIKLRGAVQRTLRVAS